MTLMRTHALLVTLKKVCFFLIQSIRYMNICLPTCFVLDRLAKFREIHCITLYYVFLSKMFFCIFFCVFVVLHIIPPSLIPFV